MAVSPGPAYMPGEADIGESRRPVTPAPLPTELLAMIGVILDCEVYDGEVEEAVDGDRWPDGFDGNSDPDS